jgi:hypothetical protein
MEGNMPGIENSLIDQLLAIRANLTSVVRAADDISCKLDGPHDGAENKAQFPQSSNMRGVINEIDCLTARLQKLVTEQHQLLGSFAPAPEAGQPSKRAYA